MKRFFTLLLTAMSMAVSAQTEDVPVQTGTYGNDYESLSAWECPEWFKDAKFGIWAHWGPQCQAEGRRLNNPFSKSTNGQLRKGIYIMDGQKVMMK